MRHPLVISTLALLLGACGELPEREVGFDSPDPAGRVEALRQAAAERDPEAVPELVRMLRSDDPAQRMLANRALVDITGEDFGFDHSAPEAERLGACARWEEWLRTKGPAGERRAQSAAAGEISGPIPAPEARR